MKTDKIAIYVLIFGCFSLTACGLKKAPKAEDDSVVVSGSYPKPDPEETGKCANPPTPSSLQDRP